MIRERREEDLDRLCAVLETLTSSSGLLAGKAPREWLEEQDAERSWVFDMAPVRVTPTGNVVGHVQIHSPPASLLECLDEPAGGLLAIGKLFVRPHTHGYGVGRYLLRESVRYIRARGMLPVLDLRGDRFFAREFYERSGFDEVPCGDADAGPMIYTR